jgi:hypothetical protein
MDYRKFVRLTQRVSAAGSRRQALRAVLGAALAGIAMSEATAKPKDKQVKSGKQCRPGASPDADPCADTRRYPVPPGSAPERCCPNGFCSCGGICCGNGCFKTGSVEAPTRVFCCSDPTYVECPAASGDGETCCEDSCETCGDLGPTGISGSYRRR